MKRIHLNVFQYKNFAWPLLLGFHFGPSDLQAANTLIAILHYLRQYTMCMKSPSDPIPVNTSEPEPVNHGGSFAPVYALRGIQVGLTGEEVPRVHKGKM